MAYSSVRVQFEIGHEASVRTKKTPEGFTHDWEVFVRGADNTDIQHFVDKVVFHLHETFLKPKRVIKEPPYSVKESGYAGFVLPIHVYLKNKEEPKKISFQYDLNLQSSGPPISRVLREPRLFQNPSEDFRRKLIRGGGVGVDTPSEIQTEDLKPATLITQNKSKVPESSVKKHKSDQPLNHSFAELFGPPIRRVPEPKKLPEPPKKVADESPKDKKKSSKHGPYKDEKELTKEKEKYLEKEKNKERDKSKEKPSKKPPSPPSASQIKPKEEYKKHEEKEKKKEEHDDKKKRKEEKEKKEKIRDVKELDRQFEKEHKKEKKEPKDCDYAKKLNSGKLHEIKPNFEKHNSEVIDKEKERLDKEKHKHRHKKKEKEKNRDKEKHRKEKEKIDSKEREREKEKSNKKRHEEVREKEEKRRKSRSPSPVHERMKKGPLNALLDELGSSDSASPLSEDESISPVKPLPKTPVKIVPEIKTQPIITPKFKSTNLNEVRHEKETEKTPKFEEISVVKNKKEKSSSKKNKKSEKDAEKKRGKEEHRARSVSSEREKEDEEAEKERLIREERERLEKERLEEEKPKSKDKENRKRKREKSEEKQKAKKENNVVASQSTVPVEPSDSPEEIRRSDKFTKEYVAQLKDLQRRIMTLEDNAELQKVVKVIADTGQYEITKKTFDFDLCALDFETVKRLQEFFAPT